MTRRVHWFLVPALLAGLAACADETPERDAGREAGTTELSELPAPEGAVGSVTGMPANPGPGEVPIEPVAPAPAAPAGDAALGPAQVAGEAGGPPPPAPAASVDGVEIFGGVPPSVEASADAPPATVVQAPPPTGGEPPVTASTTFVTEPATTGETHPEGHDPEGHDDH